MRNSIRKQIAKLIGIGYLKIVANKQRNFGSNNFYKHVKVIDNTGIKVDLLFTLAEIQDAKERAEKNKEDYA
jgi:predicted TIM-barrel fold metal-dependent hydrolase